MATPNKQQQECIDSIKGQYLVLAGPGTGKTFTVSRRIENMVKQGIAPNKILCLTFSDTAATEMKNKINDTLGKIEGSVISTHITVFVMILFQAIFMNLTFLKTVNSLQIQLKEVS